jgi:hypothetical protein
LSEAEGADEGKESNGMPGGASTSSSMISVRACCSTQWSVRSLWPLFLGVLLWQNEGNCVKTTSGCGCGGRSHSNA